jgi:penicillin-binding protein 1C
VQPTKELIINFTLRGKEKGLLCGSVSLREKNYPFRELYYNKVKMSRMNQIKSYIAANRKKVVALTTLLLLAFVVVLLPPVSFEAPTSTAVFDRHSHLLGAQIAADGQWRFPSGEEIGEKFETCLLLFEDQYFYRHPGVNPGSIIRAAVQNIRARRIVSGGSTITMQVVRLSGKESKRTFSRKALEILRAIHTELHYSKSGILSLYAANAPFGGNVVGVEAAAWRYFGRSPFNLSWAEAACLAVLPNAPALIHPGRNREMLRQKRNTLLLKLHKKGIIDSLTYQLACDEPLPDKPLPLPGEATHLTAAMAASQRGMQVNTTVDLQLQTQVNQIVDRHHKMLAGNRIHNAAVLVLDVVTGEVLVYTGNTRQTFAGDHANQVDIIRRPRSSGSLLKPFLYAAMLSDGEVLPNTLIPDIPTTISSFTPKNFDVTYDGAVPAREALIRSLNIPAVRMLSDYGLSRFHQLLQKAGFSTVTHPPDHYGLSLILGGAEVTLWDACAAYRAMAVRLIANQSPGIRPAAGSISLAHSQAPDAGADLSNLDEAAIYLTLDAMREVKRPEAEAGWESFLGTHPIAWKTGTSFGFRDAWAIGMTPGYVVGVWVGNASGEGRPGLIGLLSAAPLMFDVFSILPDNYEWFIPPYDKMVELAVCRQSGSRPSMYCTDIDTLWLNHAALNTPVCAYHHPVHLNSSAEFRVTAECYPADEMITRSWFVLPPAMAWFYQKRNPFYLTLPPWLPGCQPATGRPMQLVWPDKPSRIFLPRQMDGSPGEIVFEVAHARPATVIYWYLNDSFIGETRNLHKMNMKPPHGNHNLVLMDEDGNIFTQPFEVVGR